MLYSETVESGTLALLEQLQALEELQNFHLVGGTALALQFGHRKSIDIDLFGSALDKPIVIQKLKENFTSFRFVQSPNNWSLFCYINEIKVDVVQFQYPLIFPLISEQGIRMYHHLDIAAMKINAVLNRGTKKDFWDICELLDHVSLSQIIEAFERKFPDHRLMISIPQALVYFEDAESDPPPVCLKNRNWVSVKKKIRNEVSKYLN